MPKWYFSLYKIENLGPEMGDFRAEGVEPGGWKWQYFVGLVAKHENLGKKHKMQKKRVKKLQGFIAKTSQQQ